GGVNDASGGASARANAISARRSAAGTSRLSASRAAIWTEGRRSSASSLRMVTTEQPTRRASASWVRSSVRRRQCSQRPNEISGSIGLSPFLQLERADVEHTGSLLLYTLTRGKHNSAPVLRAPGGRGQAMRG